jgi:hypothetical protein
VAGDTALVCIATLRIQWDSHSSYAAICTHWTITKDQLVRLRNVLPLPKRLDRRMRYRPIGTAWEPPPEEITASEDSLNLAPLVAARATCVTVNWTDDVRASRQVQKPQSFRVATVDLPDEYRDAERGQPG